MGVFIWDPRQLLDIDMDEARLIILKGFLWLLRIFRLGNQGLQMGDTLPAPAAIQTRARHVRMDTFARHRQQVISGEKQGVASRDDDPLWGRSQGRMKAMGTMRRILR